MNKKYTPLNIMLFFFIATALFSCNKEGNTDLQLLAQFSVSNNNCVAPCKVSFTNESEGASTYFWDFGNGKKSTLENPAEVEYTSEGQYEVTLEVRDKDWEKQVITKQITIAGNTPELDFITGMDLSYQPLMDENSIVFKDESGTPISNFYQYAHDNGVNLVRVRLFHTPDPSDKVVSKGRLQNVLDICRKVKETGNNILLDFHYSDTWADPGSQHIPSAWLGKPFGELKDSVYAYTKFVLEQMQQQNTLPEIIQIGNEINSGMLWDQGKVWGDFDDNWENLVALINASKQAIEEIETESGKDIQTMIHRAGINDAQWFYDKLFGAGADFDIIGLSYYSWWHGKDIVEIENSLQSIANLYNKPIVIAETMYPFTLQWNDWTDNVFGDAANLVEGYDATPEGQKAFYENLVQILKNLPNNLGKGFIYWAPDYVAFDGNQSNEGSAFENLCTFDFDNKALPVMAVFRNN
jgi:arabinogalactan endo-1,4-beta-galactosidase